MTSLRERLTEVFTKSLKESQDSSKEMIADNVTSFENMGMAHTTPGEFSQEEITDVKNLENTGHMANDTDFEGKVKCDDENCTCNHNIDDVVNDLASDIVDISVKTDDDEDQVIKDEKMLMQIAHESVDTSLMSMFKKKLTEAESSEYIVYMWPFAGYQTYPFKVEASHEQEAVEKAVARADEQGDVQFFADDVEDAEQHPDLYLYVDATMEGASQPHYIDAQNLRIEKANNSFGESVRRKLKESEYAGPLSFVPDTRFSVSDVVNALKAKIGEGSQGIHVDQELDGEGNKVYVVTQIDEEKLPAELDVVNVTLKKDGNKYTVKGMAKDFPAMK